MGNETSIPTDHDLLIELRVELKGLRDDVKTLANDTRDRLVRLEETKLDSKTFTDFLSEYKVERADKERRVRFLERWGWAAWGIICFIQFALIIYVAFLHR